MRASLMINRLVQMIVAHGDKELRIGNECVITVVEDYESKLVSAGEASETRVFRIIPTGEKV